MTETLKRHLSVGCERIWQRCGVPADTRYPKKKKKREIQPGNSRNVYDLEAITVCRGDEEKVSWK